MPPSLQAKLLRVLEEKQIRPLGADRAFPVNVRVLSATNANLEQQIAKGQFREDLFFRLNVVTCIRDPPLKNEKEDIALLAAHFNPGVFPARAAPANRSFSARTARTIFLAWKCPPVIQYHRTGGSVGRRRNADS
jgi:transcriptional regulator with GAF, ATPase, and Fis domain